jgi:DNA invertase Pin-like site-specific DNA recombinase
MTRALAILRVSRIKEDALSPDVQRAAVIRFAEEKGWFLDPEDVANENVDQNGRSRNVSGSWELKDRPKLKHAIEEVESGRAQVILAERFDRLFRNELLRRMVVKRLEEAGGEMWSVMSGQMTNQNAEGRLSNNVNGDVSEYTLETAKERSNAAVQRRIDEGKWPMRQTPAGYIRDADDQLRPDPASRHIIEAAFRMRAEGETIAAVQAFLAENGVERSYRLTHVLLHSPVYRGQLHYGKHRPNLTAYEPLVSEDLFAEVQAMRNGIPRPKHTKSDLLLARQKVAFCEGCGARLVAGAAHGKKAEKDRDGRYQPAYQCGNRTCEQRAWIAAELLDSIVIEAVTEAIKGMVGRASIETSVRDLEAALAKAQANLAAYLGLPLDFTSATVAAKATELGSAVQTAERALSGVRGRTRTVELDAVEDWDSLSLDGRRAIVREVVERVTVARGRGPERVTVTLRE